MKLCPKCGKNKPTTEFHKNRARHDGLANYCKPCVNTLSREHRQGDTYKTRVTREYHRDKNLQHKYGLSIELYDRMFEEQGGVCKICKTLPDKKRLHVDHNHNTGEIRGLLCNLCNLLIGSGRDNPLLLRKAAQYLSNSDQEWLDSFEKWANSLNNFATLGVAGLASDLDFFMHAHSSDGSDHFLVIEGKPVGGSLPLGQKIAFSALQKQDFTVVVVYGPDKDGLFVLSWDWSGKVDLGGLRTLVALWWKNNKKSSVSTQRSKTN